MNWDEYSNHGTIDLMANSGITNGVVNCCYGKSLPKNNGKYALVSLDGMAGSGLKR